MIKLIVFSALLNVSDSNVSINLPQESIITEARRRDKRGQIGRRLPGGGLR